MVNANGFLTSSLRFSLGTSCPFFILLSRVLVPYIEVLHAHLASLQLILANMTATGRVFRRIELLQWLGLDFGGEVGAYACP